MTDPDVRRSYYQRNRERCLEQSRRYVYQRREHYKAYCAEYYKKNKETLLAKERQRKQAKTKAQETYIRAKLDAPNENPIAEKRRQLYEQISAIPLPNQVAKERIQSWVATPDDFVVRFD